MQAWECFKTTLWSEEKPEFIVSLNKASDPYIKEAKKKNSDHIKKYGDFGISYHSEPLTLDTKFKDFHNYVGQKCWEFLDWQGFDMSLYQTFYGQSRVREFAKNGGGHSSAHVHYHMLNLVVIVSYPKH